MYVPIINYTDPASATAFNLALKEIGFAVISNHPVKSELISAVFNEWEAFFNTEEKYKYPYNNEKQDGYFPFRSENAKGYSHKNLVEFYNVYPWGQYPKTLSSAALELHAELTKLASNLLGWLDQTLPETIRLENSLAGIIENSPNQLLRILHYPALKGDEHPAEIRSEAHEDCNLITLLPSPSTPGLQVKDKQDQWRDVHSNEGDIIINVGDMLKILTQGYYRSTTHRVINPAGSVSNEARMSTPFFVHPRNEVRLNAEYTAGEYVEFLLRSNGVLT